MQAIRNIFGWCHSNHATWFSPQCFAEAETQWAIPPIAYWGEADVEMREEETHNDCMEWTCEPTVAQEPQVLVLLPEPMDVDSLVTVREATDLQDIAMADAETQAVSLSAIVTAEGRAAACRHLTSLRWKATIRNGMTSFGRHITRGTPPSYNRGKYIAAHILKKRETRPPPPANSGYTPSRFASKVVERVARRMRVGCEREALSPIALQRMAKDAMAWSQWRDQTTSGLEDYETVEARDAVGAMEFAFTFKYPPQDAEETHAAEAEVFLDGLLDLLQAADAAEYRTPASNIDEDGLVIAFATKASIKDATEV
ncbi:hypothetical protein BXZ70DRAFT_955815, partial [Cristinia sonorae]